MKKKTVRKEGRRKDEKREMRSKRGKKHGEGRGLRTDKQRKLCMPSLQRKKEALQKGEGGSAQTAQAAHASSQEKALGTFS